MVRVLLFQPSNQFGGAERSVLNVLKYLDHGTVQVVLVGNEGIFGGTPGCEFVSSQSLGVSEGFVGIPTAWRDAWKLSQCAKAKGCTVMLGFLHYGAILAALCRFTSFFRLKTIASPRTPSRLAIKLLVGEGGRQARLWHCLVHFFARFSNLLIVPSHGLKEECIKYGATPDAVRVVLNGVDFDLVERAEKTLAVAAPKTGLRVITVGRLAPEKDMGTLIRAFARVVQAFQDAELWIVGEGSEQVRLEQLSLELGLSGHIRFLGFQENPFAWIKSADVLVHTALYEGIGNVILEGMACGVPVVATDCDFGPREVIQDGCNGYLVRVSDAGHLAQVLVALMADPALRARLAEAGSATLERFNVISMAKGFERAFLEVGAGR